MTSTPKLIDRTNDRSIPGYTAIIIVYGPNGGQYHSGPLREEQLIEVATEMLDKARAIRERKRKVAA